MSDFTQDNVCVQDEETSSPPDRRPRRFASKAPTPKEGKDGAQPPLGSSPLLCDSWGIPQRRRLQIGFVGLTFLFPFISLTLAYPEWTGHIGTRLSLGLFSLFGDAALIVPVLCLYIILSCAGFRPLRRTRYLYLFPLFICTVMLLQRGWSNGGWVGRQLDGLLLAALGPGGAWLLTGTLLSLVSVAFFPRVRKELLQFVSLTIEHIGESRLRLRNWCARVFAPRPKKVVEESIEVEIKTPKSKASETPSSAEPIDEATDEPDHDRHSAPIFLSTDGVAPQQLDEPSIETLPTQNQYESVGDHTVLEASAIGSDRAGEVTAEIVSASDNIVRFADSTEIEESLELEKPKLTNSDEAQAAVPRARVFELPPLVLLDDVPHADRQRPTEDKSKALLDALDAFGVKAKLLQIVRGPTVTRYELQPARGVKVSKFTSLTNDIALALASTAIRIEAPIPGKSAIGIEIPNRYTDLVVLKQVIRDSTFTQSKGLTVALGKDLSGRPVVTDLQKMPHLLVAGTTGSGKSVCINGLIVSLLYRFTPDQLQLMMVDPKQVELSVYEDIPHLVGFSESEGGEIIVDPKKAAQALHQVVGLMEERYKLFAENKVRNLAEYNEKFTDEPLPWFVVIIDELADLMMVASKSVETSICRIAQKARAAGIHLVLATQRPSADVITGLIKVNIPSRIAFAVSSQVDSRVILDTGGAEHLLGKGDMLFQPVDASDPKRLQGCYVGNEEISRVVEFWKGQGRPDNCIEFEFKEDILSEGNDEDAEDPDDALLQEALRVTLNRKQASASMLQTELKVGYARARRLLIAMEKKGWVGPPDGSKPRTILFSGPLPDLNPEE